ncbi:MAG: SH3 domain-containing protein, partial [Anaerolineae bacterium]|nr:SH3 domain-containing protein [Anaerolineae bacterium]
TDTPLPTATNTPRPSLTPLPTIGPTDTPSPTPTNTPPPTLTPLPTLTPTITNTPRPTFTPAPTGTPTRTLSPDEISLLLGTPVATPTALPTIPPPTQNVTPTFITAAPNTPVSNTAIPVSSTPFEVQPSATAQPLPTRTPLNLPTIQPIDPQIRAFALTTEGGIARGGFPLLRDATLFERNPVNPAQYAVTDSSGQLYFTGVNGENAARVDVSPFSEFMAFSPEENTALVRDIAWSPDGRYLAFLVDSERSAEQANDGVWFFQPGVMPPNQLIVDCPRPDHPGCTITSNPLGPDLWQSVALEWSPESNALLVQTYLPSEDRLSLTVIRTTFSDNVRDARPPVIRYDYGSWSNDGRRILVSGAAPDGNIYLAWINPDDPNQIEVVFVSRDAGLWTQNAVQRPDGSIVTLGAPFSEGGSDGAQRIYTSGGQPLTGPIGTGKPERVEWSPDRSAVLVVQGGRMYLATIAGEVTDITDEVAGAQAINWVTGSIPIVDSPQNAPPDASGVTPIGVRPDQPERQYPAGTVLRVIAADGLFVRQQPDVNAPEIASVLQGETVTIQASDPVSSGNIVWWEVQAPDGSIGWLAGEIDGEALIQP